MRGISKSTSRRLLRYVKPYTGIALLSVFLVLVTLGIELLLPLALGRGLLDSILIERRYLAYLNLFVVGILVAFAVKGILGFAQIYALAYVGQRVVFDLRNDLFDHLQRLSLRFFERYRTGETMARVTNDVTLIQTAVTNSLRDLVHDAFMSVGILLFIFYLHWQLSLITLVMLPLVALAVNAYGKRIRRFTTSMQGRVGEISTQLQESFTGIRVVKAFTMEEHERQRFVKKNEEAFRSGMKTGQTMAAVVPVVELITVAGMVLVLWYGTREVVAERLTAGDLIAFISYLGMASAPINGLTRSASQFQQAFAAGDRVFQLLDEKVEVEEAAMPVELQHVQGRVSFSGVSFAYNEGESVLEDINLVVNPGEVVALVGPSGAGKSTLVNLLPRFYDPTAGEVTVDGVDLKSVSLYSLRSQIGLVPQDTILFGVSIAENIRYGRPGATQAEVEEAARLANANDFVAQLPQGYNTLVGERGTSLSGGQKQRIAIARALLRDPRILILDEATSNLDTESEALVQEALERLMKDRTTFVIAHRLSTVMHADRILVLQGGRIVQEGRHDELLQQGGLYKRLFEAQFKADLQ